MCLERVQEDVRESAELVLDWKSYLLRPYPEPKPLEAFRRYTESWRRPAAQVDAGEFRVWATDEAPLSHSIPPAIAVKAAARQGAFERFHLALMNAYFARNLDVTSLSNIARVARECDLDFARFAADCDDPELGRQVIAEHNEAVELGISGAPCVVLDGGFQLPGSQDRAVYCNIVQRLLARQGTP